MGVDLRLLPMDNEHPSCNISMMIFEVNRDDDFFNEVKICSDTYGRDVSRGGIIGYGNNDDYGIETLGMLVEFDKYGTVLKSITTKQFIEVIESYSEFKDDKFLDYWGNKALLEYFKCCPPKLPIYLFWH